METKVKTKAAPKPAPKPKNLKEDYSPSDIRGLYGCLKGKIHYDENADIFNLKKL